MTQAPCAGPIVGRGAGLTGCPQAVAAACSTPGSRRQGTSRAPRSARHFVVGPSVAAAADRPQGRPHAGPPPARRSANLFEYDSRTAGRHGRTPRGAALESAPRTRGSCPTIPAARWRGPSAGRCRGMLRVRSGAGACAQHTASVCCPTPATTTRLHLGKRYAGGAPVRPPNASPVVRPTRRPGCRCRQFQTGRRPSTLSTGPRRWERTSPLRPGDDGARRDLHRRPAAGLPDHRDGWRWEPVRPAAGREVTRTGKAKDGHRRRTLWHARAHHPDAGDRHPKDGPQHRARVPREPPADSPARLGLRIS